MAPCIAGSAAADAGCSGGAGYGVRCSGSCQIMAYAELQHRRQVDEGTAELKDFMDPYCFKDLLDDRGHTADLEAPCGGAGMDGF